MNLRGYVERRIEEENKLIVNNKHIEFAPTYDAGQIVDIYRTYNGLRRQMRPLNEEQVETYLKNGYAFVGAYYDKELAGIVVSKKLPENYPFFHLPKNEQQGDVYTLGGLYVKKEYEGLGLASKLSRIITNGTKDYGVETQETVGMAYEISYDNFGSLKVLSKHGNYVGFYHDGFKEEGLSILLYKPFLHEAVSVEDPSIKLVSTNEEFSKISLENALNQMSQDERIGGVTNYETEISEGNTVYSTVIDQTPNTIPTETFEIVN